MEPVEVSNTACLLRGEMEECEAIAAEVRPVIMHLQRVADGCPFPAVEAVSESCLHSLNHDLLADDIIDAGMKFVRRCRG